MTLTKVTLIAAAAAVATPALALAQLAGSGNLVNTQSQQPNWNGNGNHQSTTMINGGGGTRGVIYGVNGGDLAPGVKKDGLVVDPKQVSSNTQNRSAGFWVEAGAQNGGLAKGATVRADVANNLGAGPKDTYRGVDVNLGNGAGKVVSGVGSSAPTGNLGN